MKRITILIMIVCLLVSSSGNIIAKERVIRGGTTRTGNSLTKEDKKTTQDQLKIKDIVNSVAKMPDFNIWSDATVKFDAKIYNYLDEGNLKLYSVSNKYGIIGYVILDSSRNDIVEFAVGESPFENLLERNKNGNTKAKYKLVKEGLVNAYITDESLPAKELVGSVFENKDSLNSVERTKEVTIERNFTRGAVGAWSYEKILSVEDKFNKTSLGMSGCGPVSAINLIRYWDIRGYSNLVVSGDTDKSIYDELYDYMNSFPLNGGIATWPGGYEIGLEEYFNDNGNYSLSISRYNPVYNSHYTTLKNEVNASRPGTVLFDSGPYGMHYTTFVGYATESMTGDQYYIIHDLWQSTPENVYRNWYYDTQTGNYIWELMTVDPN